MDKNAKIFVSVLIIVVLGVIAAAFLRTDSTSDVADKGELDEFTMCLADQGAVFYGAFWCKYCQATKKEFGSSQKLLPYVECSTPDGRSQLPECREKNIEGYPTWEFADGSRLNGVISFEQLSEKTGCVLPGAGDAETTTVEE